MIECMSVHVCESNVYANYLCNSSHLTFCFLLQSDNCTTRESFSPARPLDSSLWATGFAYSCRYLSSARPLRLQSAGWPAWSFAHDHRVNPSDGLSSARPASPPPLDWSRKWPALHVALSMEAGLGGAGLLLSALILNPHPCPSLPLQLATSPNLMFHFLNSFHSSPHPAIPISYLYLCLLIVYSFL